MYNYLKINERKLFFIKLLIYQKHVLFLLFLALTRWPPHMEVLVCMEKNFENIFRGVGLLERGVIEIYCK